jgi:hypothetical protein
VDEELARLDLAGDLLSVDGHRDVHVGSGLLVEGASR